MKIVIVGGGFGGLRMARKLNNKPGFDVVLLDRFNFHQFQPLFYQVATAGLDASNISFPLRKVFQHSKNIRIRLGALREILNDQQKIRIDNGTEIDYDVLVLATGADTNFFGNPQLAAHTAPMKSTIEALQLRNRLIQNFEDAVSATNEETIQQLLTIVVVGAGPTGVELSGAIADMKNYVLPKDYPELNFRKMKIYLLEGSAETLPTMSDKSSAQSKEYLQKLGVTLLLNSIVKDYDGQTVTLNDGTTIQTKIVIWAAGIKGNIPAGIQPELVAKGNRIKVDRYNKIMNSTNIYAIGDVAYMTTPLYPNAHPQVAQTAIQQADNLVKNLKLLQDNSPMKYDFEYHDRGSLATIGRNLAVVDLPKLHMGGFFAWLIWMGLHLMLIVGVKNRFFVFCNWLYNYVTRDQSLRLILKGVVDTATRKQDKSLQKVL